MEKKITRIPIPGILYTVYLVWWFSFTKASISTGTLLPLVAMALLCVAMLVNCKNVFLVLALGFHAVCTAFSSVNLIKTLLDLSHYIGQDMQQPIKTIMLGAILEVCGIVFMTVFAAVMTRKRTPEAESKAANLFGKLWFVPGVLSLLSLVVNFSGTLTSGIVFGVILAAAWTLLGYWIKKAWEEAPDAEATETEGFAEGYCSLINHVLLSLFTFGIWPLIWVYRTTKFLNRAPDAEYHDPGSKLLLCIFVPFYQLYWYYKQGQRIDSFAKYKKLYASDMATMCLIFGIFIPIVANILMQDRINAICSAKADGE